jgi:hypothetical protein
MQRMHTHQTPPPAVSWRTHLSLALLALVYIFSFIDRQVLSILLEPVKQEFGASDTEMGLLTGLAFGLIYAMLGVPVGVWPTPATAATSWPCAAGSGALPPLPAAWPPSTGTCCWPA